jgi:hypothetical protein
VACALTAPDDRSLAATPLPTPPPVGPPSPRVADTLAPSHCVAPALPAPLNTEHALEVVAMLGDSVVAIKLCAVPRRRRRWVRAWLALAVVAAVVAVIALGAAVRVAARNQVERQHWEAQGRPPASFRPRLLGSGYDLAALGGLGVTLLAVSAGAAAARRRGLQPGFRLGTDADVDLPLASAPAASFPLVATRGDQLVVRLPPAPSGELSCDGRVIPLAELAALGWARPADGGLELVMPQRGRLRLRVGELSLLLTAVSRPASALVALAPHFEHRAIRYVALSAAAHLVLWAVLRALPLDATVGSLEFDQTEEPELRTRGTEREARLEPDVADDANSAAGGGSGGAAMALASGVAGDRQASGQERRPAIRRSDDAIQLTREQAIAEAVEMGMLGTRSLRAAAFQNITGTADVSSGVDAAFAAGDWFGEPGAAAGAFAGGASGVGPGGGDLLRAGSYDTIGPGGFCDASQPCRGGFGSSYAIKPRGQVTPTLRISEPTVCGGGDDCGLDKATVRRYLQRSRDKIRYCYEKQLLVHPELEGTVQSSFLISPTGTVLRASASGVQREVSECVAGVISSIAFPRPGSGGAVQVNFPFLFRRS